MPPFEEGAGALHVAAGHAPRRQRARRFRFIPLLALLQLLPPSAEAQNTSRPYRIDTIIVHRRNVFGARSGWLGSVANSLHVLTREEVIRQELLLEPGDQPDQDLLDESERNLRALGIIGDVAVIPDTLPGRRVHVHVYAHDRWTLGLKPSYKQEGGVRDMRLMLNDDNFIGSGQSFTLGYNYRSDRDNPSGEEIDWVNRRLFGSRLGMNLQYRNSEDDVLGSIDLERPFFSDETPWAGGVSASKERERLRIYQGDVLTLTEHRRSEVETLWGALSSGTNTKYRFGAAYVRSRADRGSLPSSALDQLDLLTMGVALSERKFYKGRFIENFGRVEDVPLGYLVSLIGGPNIRFSPAAKSDAFVRLDGNYALGGNQEWYLNLGFSASTFFDGGEARDALLQPEITGFWRAGTLTTLVWHFLYSRGLNWATGRQFLLGSPTGLRGYDAAAFSGTQQALVNFQYRLFSRLSLWIFRIGGALFLDSGTAWGGSLPVWSQRLHSSAGIGLRIENAAQQGPGLVSIDLPFNFDEHRFTEIAISSTQLFQAFADLAFIPPTSIR